MTDLIRELEELEARNVGAAVYEVARIKAKAAQIAAMARTGHTLQVRLDKRTVLEGKVLKVEPGRLYRTGRSLGMNFKVTMECGAAKAVREVHIRRVQC